MTRQRLNDRRHCETWEFTFEKIACTVSYGRGDDGRIREIFIDAGKSGTAFEAMTSDASTIASIALQHGITPQELAHSVIRNPDGSPSSPIGVVIDDMVMG